MALITIAEAGRLTGKGRPAIYAAINAAPPHNLSVIVSDDNGRKMLDPAEVQRVFGPFKNAPAQVAAPAAVGGETALINSLQAQIEQLKAAAAKAESRETAANERATAAEARAAKAEAKADDFLIRLLAPPPQPTPPPQAEAVPPVPAAQTDPPPPVPAEPPAVEPQPTRKQKPIPAPVESPAPVDPCHGITDDWLTECRRRQPTFWQRFKNTVFGGDE